MNDPRYASQTHPSLIHSRRGWWATVFGGMSNGAVNEARIRVLVVDDHHLYRTGLATLLSAEPDIEVVAQASGGRMGVRLAGELRPDVVLMDIRMPDLSGAEATRKIVDEHPNARVLALTVASEDTDVATALQAGACGFVAKDTALESLVVAIRAAASGAAWLSPRAAQVVLGRLRTSTPRIVPSEQGTESHSARAAVRARARGLAAYCLRDGERRDRDRTEYQPADREEPRIEHPRQARPAQPCPSRGLRGPTGSDVIFEPAL